VIEITEKKIFDGYEYCSCWEPTEGIVLDPFLGSATTMKCCIEEKRSCVGIELNKKYIDYSKKRLNWGSIFNCECSDKF
jgi:DNA modification methylase